MSPAYRRSTLFIKYGKRLEGTGFEENLTEIAWEINEELGFYAVEFVLGSDGTCEIHNGVSELCFKELDRISGRCGHNMKAIFETNSWNGTYTELKKYFPDKILRHLTAKVKKVNLLKNKRIPYKYAPLFEWGEISESDIHLDTKGYDPYFENEVIKHEVLHGIGFGHWPRGVMHASIFGNRGIDPEQIQIWKEFVHSKGGFYEIHLLDERVLSLY